MEKKTFLLQSQRINIIIYKKILLKKKKARLLFKDEMTKVGHLLLLTLWLVFILHHTELKNLLHQ